MRLVSKLTMLLMIGICAVLIADGYFAVQREIRLFDTDMRSDTQLYGRMFALAMQDVWDTQGEDRALELVGHANAEHLGVDVRWVWLDRETPASLRPRAPGLARSASLAEGRAVSATLDDDYLVTYVPVRVGARIGAIEFAESLRKRDSYTATTVRRVVFLVAATVLVCAALAIILGALVVGRPVRALVARTRAIGRGELEGSLDMGQRDELGVIAAEIDTMARRLAVSAERFSAERAERLRAEEQVRLADRLTTVGTLAAGVAHELGTPLNVVSERASMIQHDQLPTAEIPDSARIIREQAQRMTGIIRQLLDFARRQPPHKARYDVGDILRETADLLGGLAGENDVTIDIEPADRSPIEADVDREQIRQALTNLIMNAVQASSPGERVRVTLDTVAGDDNVEQVRICVIDTGVGMRADQVPHVFEPFFTTKDVGVGTGLGLSVTHGIVRDHDGTIDIESRHGEGTRVVVHLPRTARA